MKSVNMKVNILSDKILWFGKYSGYECLTDYFSSDVSLSLTIPYYAFINKFFGKFNFHISSMQQYITIVLVVIIL